MWNRKGVEKLSGTNGRSMRIRLRYFVVFHSKIPFELLVQEFLECCCYVNQQRDISRAIENIGTMYHAIKVQVNKWSLRSSLR